MHSVLRLRPAQTESMYPACTEALPMVCNMAYTSPMFARVPQEGGRVHGWESVCWGLGGFLVPWFLGFKVVWFVGFLSFGFLIYWLLAFLVSRFLGSKKYWSLGLLVSWFRSLKDLPNCHFMFFGRYWCRIQDVQENLRQIFMNHDVLVLVFPKKWNVRVSNV